MVGTNPAPVTAVLSAGNLIVDLERREALLDGRSVYLTYQEFEAMVFLLQRPDSVQSRERLCVQLWDSHGPSEVKRAAVLISRLRRKQTGLEPYAIEAVARRGYGLVKRAPPAA